MSESCSSSLSASHPDHPVALGSQWSRSKIQKILSEAAKGLSRILNLSGPPSSYLLLSFLHSRCHGDHLLRGGGRGGVQVAQWKAIA
jgi:hypothetical protein